MLNTNIFGSQKCTKMAQREYNLKIKKRYQIHYSYCLQTIMSVSDVQCKPFPCPV